LIPSAPGVLVCRPCVLRGRDGEQVTRSLVAALAAENIELRRRLGEAQPGRKAS